MRSIKARFQNEQKEGVSTYIAFLRAVKEQGFSRDNIARNFLRFVDKNDYKRNQKNNLVDQLYKLSKTLEEHEIDTKSPLQLSK